MNKDYIYWVRSTSQDGFGIDRTWQAQLHKAGALCSHCNNIRPEHARDIDRAVVRNTESVNSHTGSVGQLGGNEVLSNELFDLIGQPRIEKLGHIVPIVNSNGQPYDTHKCVIDRQKTPGLLRGPNPYQPGLCKVCSRLMYWPGSTESEWYILRQYWDEHADCLLIDGFLVCSPDLWEKTIKPAKLRQLKGYKIKIVDEPTDGLPADYQGLINELTRRNAAQVDYMETNLLTRVRQFAEEMPIAKFTTSPLWDKAQWKATTFVWHPTSEAPPTMGLVFENAEAGKELFRDLEMAYNHTDRFEEMRISIIEGSPPGQRYGYSVHICPDPDALAMYATGKEVVLDSQANRVFGRWSRMYPIPGSPPLLAKFKEEYAKHGEYQLVPVVQRTDGQFWAEPLLGFIKHSIEFRMLSEIATDDIDATALLLPRLITPAI